MSTSDVAASAHDWVSRLSKPNSQIAARFIQQLHEAPGQLQDVIAAPPLPDGNTLDHFKASLYEALCANPDLPDAIALPALELFHEVHSPPLLEPLDAGRRHVDSCPALLSLQRPAWLKVLLGSRGLKAGARYKPSGGPLRRLQNSTLLHVVVLAIALAPGPQQRQALERSFTQLLLAGADFCALDSCGLVALEWMVRDALRGQGVSSRQAKYLSPTVVRQLWSDKYTSTVLNFLSSKPAEEVLPLLQLPLQQAIRQLLQLVVRRGGVAGMPSEPCRLPAAAVMARVGSWEDLLQLLPTSAYWRHIELFQIMLAHVMVASSVAAGRPAALAQLEHSTDPEREYGLTAQHRQRLLQHYASHPDHVALYALLPAMRLKPQDTAAVQQLWRGLRSALQLQHLCSQGQAKELLRSMLDAMCRLIHSCVEKPPPASGVAPVNDALATLAQAQALAKHWLQQGLLADVQQAAALGSTEAVDLVVGLRTLNCDAAVGQALVPCLLQNPTHVASLARAAAAAAGVLDRPGPLPAVLPDAAGRLPTTLVALWACPGKEQVLAGPLLDALGRLASHRGDPRLAAASFAQSQEASAALSLAVATSHAAEMTGQLADGQAWADASMQAVKQRLEQFDIAKPMSEVHRTQQVRQQRKLYGRGCDQCGKLGAELEQQGAKLRRCLGCLQVWYCGAECQKKAWGAGHKAECKAAQKAAAIGAGAGAGSSKGAGSSSSSQLGVGAGA